ncbi:beta-galactosidase [Spirochaetia bacterium]|nr:beta-galactosidase [Spirochaetia bacterium]
MEHNLLPHLEELNGRKALYVDGKPFIILGLQWDCDGCYTPEDMDPFFEHGQKMGLNTASLLLYWREVEPVEGEYHFEMLDHRIEMARKHNMKIVLVWFASFKNGNLTYAPDYIRGDHKRFAKVKNKDGELMTNHCCPTAEETHRRDELALIQVFKHIKEVDSKDHTVIVFQIENETGVFGTDRCYCEKCNAEYAKFDYEKKYGPRAGESFSAKCIAEYCDSLTKTIKDIYPIPVYMNAWLNKIYKNERAGFDYPSGGPIPPVLDVYFETIKHIDFISPDIYQYSYKDFNYFCKAYTRKNNPLYVAECATGKGARAEKSIFYALGEYAAIGYDPWAINRCCPGFMTQPLVNTVDGQWSDDALELHKSYKMIGDAMEPIVMAQNTENLKYFVQEEGDNGALLHFGDIDVEVFYDHPKNAARGMVIRQGAAEFVLIGAGVYIAFSREGGELVSVATVESGAFEGETWIPRYRLSSERPPVAPIQLFDCRVLRVVLGDRTDKPGPHSSIKSSDHV